jgi:hypothetical protein
MGFSLAVHLLLQFLDPSILEGLVHMVKHVHLTVLHFLVLLRHAGRLFG